MRPRKIKEMISAINGAMLYVTYDDDVFCTRNLRERSYKGTRIGYAEINGQNFESEDADWHGFIYGISDRGMSMQEEFKYGCRMVITQNRKASIDEKVILSPELREVFPFQR